LYNKDEIGTELPREESLPLLLLFWLANGFLPVVDSGNMNYSVVQFTDDVEFGSRMRPPRSRSRYQHLGSIGYIDSDPGAFEEAGTVKSGRNRSRRGRRRRGQYPDISPSILPPRRRQPETIEDADSDPDPVEDVGFLYSDLEDDRNLVEEPYINGEASNPGEYYENLPRDVLHNPIALVLYVQGEEARRSRNSQSRSSSTISQEFPDEGSSVYSLPADHDEGRALYPLPADHLTLYTLEPANERPKSLRIARFQFTPGRRKSMISIRLSYPMQSVITYRESTAASPRVPVGYTLGSCIKGTHSSRGGTYRPSS
jgi:hypothetical protein